MMTTMTVDQRIASILVTGYHEVTHNALWVLVDEWTHIGHDVETLYDGIDAVLKNEKHDLGDDFTERVNQALSYTRPDGGAFFDSRFDDV